MPGSHGMHAFTRSLFAGILALGFLLAVALVVSAGLAVFAAWLSGSVAQSLLLSVLNFAVSLAVLTLLFSMLFKWLPDRKLAWREVAVGGFATALLFSTPARPLLPGTLARRHLSRHTALPLLSSCCWCGCITRRRSCCSGQS